MNYFKSFFTKKEDRYIDDLEWNIVEKEEQEKQILFVERIENHLNELNEIKIENKNLNEIKVENYSEYIENNNFIENIEFEKEIEIPYFFRDFVEMVNSFFIPDKEIRDDLERQLIQNKSNYDFNFDMLYMKN